MRVILSVTNLSHQFKILLLPLGYIKSENIKHIKSLTRTINLLLIPYKHSYKKNIL